MTITWANDDLAVLLSLLVSFLLFLGTIVFSSKVPTSLVWRNFFTLVTLKRMNFDVSKAGGTNLTLGTTLLTAIVSAKLLPAHTSFLPTPVSYTYLQIFFGALLTLALVIYFCGAQRLGAYLIADGLVFWAAFGAVFTLVLLLEELMGFPRWTLRIFQGLLLLTVLAITWARVQGTLDLLTELQGQLEKGKPAELQARADRIMQLAGQTKAVNWGEIIKVAGGVPTEAPKPLRWEVR